MTVPGAIKPNHKAVKAYCEALKLPIKRGGKSIT
jgi:hypothetical protein